MRTCTRLSLPASAVLLALAAHLAPAAAALGQPLAACAADGTLAGPVQPYANAVQMQQVVVGTSTVITEYAGAAGVVFAVTWHGAHPPDLRQLLGATRYLALQQGATRGGLHAAAQSGIDIELRAAAAMRNFTGVAWAPSLLPAGFNPATLEP